MLRRHRCLSFVLPLTFPLMTSANVPFLDLVLSVSEARERDKTRMLSFSLFSM